MCLCAYVPVRQFTVLTLIYIALYTYYYYYYCSIYLPFLFTVLLFFTKKTRYRDWGVDSKLQAKPKNKEENKMSQKTRKKREVKRTRQFRPPQGI